MNVCVMSPGWGVVVLVGVVLVVGDGEGLGVPVLDAVGPGVGGWKGCTQALISMSAIKTTVGRTMARFIKANCTLIETREGWLCNLERFSTLKDSAGQRDRTT
jgi:hypothetical protein